MKHIINHCANLIKLLTYAGQMLKIFSEKGQEKWGNGKRKLTAVVFV